MGFQFSASQVEGDIKSGKIKILVVGLGQVGLPFALHLARVGASVTGADIDQCRIDLIKQGICPINIGLVVEVFNHVRDSNSLQVTSEVAGAAKNSNIHILCLPTPLDKDRLPDFSALVSAASSVASGLKKGDLVILESTVYPGITTKLIRPILEKQSALKAGKDFGLAYCFERIDPGNTEHRIDNTPRIVGAIDEGSAAAAAAVYGLLIKAPVVKVKNCETAEMVKLTENIYRDVNIAFVNELALLCRKLDIDILEVLDAASTKWNFIPHLPGAGVGGTCIPVNPYYLMECAQEAGLDLKLVRQAREINEAMPHHMVELVTEALARTGKAVRGSKICLLGLAYKADVDDTRGAPAEEIAGELGRLGAEIICHDPLVTQAPAGTRFESSLEEAVMNADCIVITSDHSAFSSLNLKDVARLAHTPLAIVDGRHVLVPREVEALGITYLGVGRNPNSSLNIWNSGLKNKGQKGKD